MGDSATQKKNWKVSVRTILPVTTAGISACLAWAIALFQGFEVMTGASAEIVGAYHHAMAMRMSLLIVVALVFLIVTILCQRGLVLPSFSTRPLIVLTACCSLVFPVLCLIGYFFVLPIFLFYLGSVCAGISLAGFFGQWGEILAISWKHDVGNYISIAAVAAVVISFFTINLASFLPSVLFTLMPLCSLCILIYVRRIILVRTFDTPTVSVWKLVLRPKTSLMIIFYASLLGMTLYVLYGSAMLGQPRFIFILIAVAIGAVMFIICQWAAKGYVPFGSIQKYLLPIVTILFLGFAAAPGDISLVFLYIAFAVLIVLSISNYASLVALSSEYQASTCQMIAGGRIWFPLGIAAGIALCLLLENTIGLNKSTLTVITIAIIVLLAITAAFVSFVVNPIDDKESDTDLFGHGIYYRRCEVATAKYKLSKRESEVLPLLGRGRNADFIGDSLYISAHTAKTHIYHIYQKMSVSSQQELMDVLDEIEV